MGNVVYFPSKTMDLFHESDDFVRGLMGPIGSGKSVSCCTEIMKRACEQTPFDGIRKSRWGIIRNTYRELVDTTMQTFFDWFPRELGLFRAMDMKWTLTRKLEDGTQLHLEILFRALDRPDDIKKLLSLELTGGWLNEAREIPKPVLDMLQGRVGRYPSKREGGPSWFGIIADTNPPDSDHWWYNLFEETRPEGFQLFKQPSGVSEEAENVENLPEKYYFNMMQGKDEEWINVYVHGKYGFIMDGKPMYPEYQDNIHCHDEVIKFNPLLPLWIGLDFGLTPAAVFAQEQPDGQWTVIDEIVTHDMGAARFSEVLNERLNRYYKKATEILIFGDPSGDIRSQADENTPFLILEANGIIAEPTDTNDPIIRHEAAASLMLRLSMGGNSAFLLSPKCRMLRKGLAGGYKRKRVQVSGERYKDMPDKNIYSHVCEAMEYLFVGAGLGQKVVGDSYHEEDWAGIMGHMDKAAI